MFFNKEGKAVYPTAALGIVYDYEKKEQTFFGGGETNYGSALAKKSPKKKESEKCHTDDITALCINQNRTLVASGQNGLKPLVFVWDANTAEHKQTKRLPKGARLVSAISISADDYYLAASDASE